MAVQPDRQCAVQMSQSIKLQPSNFIHRDTRPLKTGLLFIYILLYEGLKYDEVCDRQSLFYS